MHAYIPYIHTYTYIIHTHTYIPITRAWFKSFIQIIECPEKEKYMWLTIRCEKSANDAAINIPWKVIAQPLWIKKRELYQKNRI